MKEPTRKDVEEILAEYTSSIRLQSSTVEKPYIIAPIGLIGSGKTTVVKKIASELGAVFISGDEIRAMYVGRNLSYHTVLIETELSAIKTFLQKGYIVAIDNDCAGRTGSAIKEQTGLSDCEMVWIHINTTEKQCIQNIESRGTSIFGADVERMLETFHKRKEKFHSNGHSVDFTCTFDGIYENTDADVKMCVEKIKRKHFRI